MDARCRGENGAAELTAKGVGSPLVSLFFKLVRGLSDQQLKDAMAACPTTPDGLADLIVMAWQTRATRGVGKGEKMLFYKMLTMLPEEAVLATLHLLPHFGYWKDVLLLHEVSGMATAIKDRALELLAEQLRKDDAALMEANKATTAGKKRVPALSLAGKYAPREKGHFDKGDQKLAKKLAVQLFGGANPARAARKYRQMLSQLNRALCTTEVLMAAHRWEEIEFAKVASLCLQRQRKAFLNEALKGKLTQAQEATGNRHPDDPARVAARQHLREALLCKGAKAVKGKQLLPHEVAQKCMAGCKALSTVEADLMHAQWEAMREGVREAMARAAEAREAAVRESAGESSGLEAMSAIKAALPKAIDLGKLVPLVDVSGSMHGTPMEVAIGMGIMVAELTHVAFRDRALTFESTPKWVDMSNCAKIAEKVRMMQGANWGGSTDFEAACEQILSAAERAKLKPDEIPDLIIFSDMQFDCARGGYYGRSVSSWETHHERLTRRFAKVGKAVCGEPYPAPRIIFWNLRGNTVGFPVQADAPNTQMLSGFSPSLLKLVLSGKDLIGDEKEVKMADGTVKVVREGPTPEETLRAALDDAAFDPIRIVLAAIKEGPLASYSFEKEDHVVVADEIKEAIEGEADGFELL
eukprot:CAMPEP_0119306702 /NCGR_PEP_ID=MMETSP1333-20130426/7384_1 /TAXON_ID=418940 /ORGANISM="Scyphosphaera apsteinii, Strain RCC1455" /LENGTH=639 /DNA_ID=CAMNT_0007310069 /DNA_START=78 /DNA_END=1997 /DNA_ORIENTATION=+